jgi:hypothetical protein
MGGLNVKVYTWSGEKKSAFTFNITVSYQLLVHTQVKQTPLETGLCLCLPWKMIRVMKLFL